MKKLSVLFVASSLTLVSSGVFAAAALPSAASTALSDISGNVTELVGLVWPPIIAAVAAVIIIKLFKRFASKI